MSKYIYLYVRQGMYESRWEDLTQIDQNEPANKYGSPYARIKADKKAYQENERGQYRIVMRRELRA